MPRIKQSDAEERENFMLSYFKANPHHSIAKANAKLEEKFGSRMRALRSYQLRDVARKGLGSPPPGGRGMKPQIIKAPKAAKASAPPPAKRPATTEFRARKVSKAEAPSNGSRIVVIEGTPDNMEFFRSAIETLSEAGLIDIKVDHSTESYVVIRA